MGRKWLTQERRTKEELFDALVKNALGFVNSSIDHLKKKPKNAIVDLYTAIELFLKARLMSEHWTLMLAKPETGDLQSLAVGDFLSVYLDDALKRIPAIIGETIEKDACNNFKALGEHRNQIVHFAHSGMDDLGATQAGVIVEVWASWHYLHALLTGEWKKVFEPYAAELHVLSQRMMHQADFIRARFEILKPQIDILGKKGKTFTACGHCKMPAAIVGTSHSWGTDYECMVCGVDDTTVVPSDAELPCPECAEPFKFCQAGVDVCPGCGFEITTDILIDLCSKSFPEGDSWCEGDGPHIASCHKCKHPQPSVFFIEGMWSCVCCFDRGWGAITCERCGEYVTGDMERIQYFACHKCEDQVRKDMLEMANVVEPLASPAEG